MPTATYTAADYKKLAGEAMLYVKGKITVGRGNKASDIISSLGDSFICVAGGRSVLNSLSKNNMTRYLRMVAAVAEENGCGNCGELSAIAFVYLLNKGVIPIDWMRLQKPGDHMFVVLGRDETSDETDTSTWGPAAIVCDPWWEEVYMPDQIVPRFKYKPESRFRLPEPEEEK
jgi:hypothetical protein